MWDKVLWFIATGGIAWLVYKLTDSKHNTYKYHAKFYLFYIYSSFWSGCIWPLFLLRPKSVHNARIGAGILSTITKFYGIKWILRNEHYLSEDRGAVVVSNHQSSLDILGLFNIWHIVYKMTAVAKKELLYIFPFGLSAYLAGVVFIDRSNKKNAYKALTATSDLMVKEKTKIWVFPEGTRNKDYTKLLPFKNGAFTMAVDAQVPIIPVVFSPYYFINNKKHIFDKGQIIIACLEPVSTEGLTAKDVPDLRDRVCKIMTDAYLKLSKEVVQSLPPDYPYTNIG